MLHALAPWLASSTAASTRLAGLAILSFIGAADHAWPSPRPSLGRLMLTVTIACVGAAPRYRVMDSPSQR